ncbi:zinc-binding dehydrogenase [Agromyces sp. Soil535]|uniref:zinc-dependent alcohol dehydrogenase n=1 Tax=Agromyces sp. Soil535 TaxID=1736390 RepID=UPI0006F2405F|nr:alcohol dehydrogenase catalytic domain-containing protein [Agromyces sp. Soil535]KRE29599.1 alcohol dehydrogenase [Agromyces sp. Soil535]
MRALVVTAPREAAVFDVPDPVPAAGELLVDVERVGICGTDVELYTGAMAYIEQGHTRFPLRLGHEWTGRVVAAGDPADEAWIGTRVTGDTMLGCGYCEYCLAGHHHVCPNREEVGIRGNWAGALAEKLLIPTRFTYEIPEHVSVTAAALVEPGGNALRAARAANIEPGHIVLVLGSGTIGLLAAQFALASGAEAHVGGVRDGSLALARSLGVQHTWKLGELAAADENQFDAVIEATSNDAMPALSVRLAKPAGRVVYIGLSSTPSLVDSREIALKDITAVGILSASPGLAGAIESFASGAVVPDAIVSEVVALDEVPARLDGRRGADAGPGPKVHVDPRLMREMSINPRRS